MTDTKQQAMAKKILVAIKKDPTRLNMGSWALPVPGEVVIPADQEPICGTAMCVAGWAAHFDGWKLDYGTAHKDGLGTQPISLAGFDALDLMDDSLFFADETVAMACLERMAKGENFTYEMVVEEADRAEAVRWAEDALS